MKHWRPLNEKARKIAARAEAESEGQDVHAMQLPLSCTTVFDPGWEVDVFGGLGALCQPVESDLYGCTDWSCWWSAQVPDVRNNPGWNDQCAVAMRDWQNFKVVTPEW